MRWLSEGAEGVDVRFAQERLVALGFGALEATGRFDAATADAVRRAQVAANLEATGTVDDATWDTLLSVELSAGPLDFSGSDEADPFAPLVEGDSGDAVFRLKEALEALGYLPSWTMTFDAETVAVVKKFQAEHGLPATGVVQEDTWNVLLSATGEGALEFAGEGAYRDVDGTGGYRYRQYEDGAIEIVASPKGKGGSTLTSGAAWEAITKEIGPYPTPEVGSLPITTGRRGADVEKIQRRLGDLGFGPLTVDGIYGRDCTAAVTRFQQAAGLDATGIVDQATWDGIVNPRPTLGAGSSASALRPCQERLVAHGFGPLTADGVWGPKTEAAVQAFQAARALPVTGEIDEVTWGKLFAASTVTVPSSVSTAEQSSLADVVKQACAGLGPEAAKVRPVLEGAITWVGKREDPKGSNGGPEIDPIVRGYFTAEQEKQYGKPPWCALAVSHWIKEGLQAADWKSTPFGARYGGASQFQEWGSKHGRLLAATGSAPPGAVFVMTRSGSGSDSSGNAKAGHVGIVIADLGDSVRTVEGNVSDSVAARTRKKAELIGYVAWW